MDELTLGDPWHLATDIGPVIDAEAQAGIRAYIDAARAEGRVLKELRRPAAGHLHRPDRDPRAAASQQMPREIFGPVLHIATFKAREIDAVIDAINATGYGLTFGLHTRIDDRVQRIVERLQVGNTYVNRNQIGAVVGSQPFGGEGLSGTGPKAGGPHYLPRFTAAPAPAAQADDRTHHADSAAQAALDRRRRASPPARHAGPARPDRRIEPPDLGPARAAALPWPRSPRPRWRRPRPSARWAATRSRRRACPPRRWPRSPAFPARCAGATPKRGRPYAQALAQPHRPDPAADRPTPDAAHVRLERHVCIDTTASGGNAQLLAAGRRTA